MASIQITDVAHTYRTPRGSLLAVDGVSFEIPARQVVAVVGPNGSGKSTLLRLVAGLLEPDRGGVEIGGRPIHGPEPRVGFVFQEPRLLPWRDALGNVSFPLETAGWPHAKRRERARRLLELVGLPEFERARPHELSGGMRQRVAIARALALEPSVLLLDEPFSALDALTRERFNLELLRLWADTGTTIVVVTHSIPEAIFLADRVIVLSPRPARVVADVHVPLARPRALADLDLASFSETAQEIRSHLVGGGDDEGGVRAPRAPDRAGETEAARRERRTADPVEALGSPAWFDPFRREGET